MQDITIAMDDALFRRAEAEAHKAGLTLPDFISGIVAQNFGWPHAASPQISQSEAVERIRRAPTLPLSENGRMPNSDERNAHR